MRCASGAGCLERWGVFPATPLTVALGIALGKPPNPTVAILLGPAVSQMPDRKEGLSHVYPADAASRTAFAGRVARKSSQTENAMMINSAVRIIESDVRLTASMADNTREGSVPV